jgi:Solitary outer membrane autotransporter beta-barrel domain
MGVALLPASLYAQQQPSQAELLRQDVIGTRVEALTILGGDFGLSDGHYSSSLPLTSGGRSDTDLTVTKFGGAGDVGIPQQLGDLPIGWQPRLQGNLGYLTSTNHLDDAAGNTNIYRDFSIEFGGGARFWFSRAFSIAPTFMGMYGRISDSFDASSGTNPVNLAAQRQAGLIDWRVESWTIRPSVNFQYLIDLDRVIVTLSSDPTYFYTQGFDDPQNGPRVRGSAGSFDNKIDVDVPLKMQVLGHELRTGGFISRTDLFGDLKTGLDVPHVYELHGRLVLDMLDQVWKVQWLGVGASYLWGTNISGWTVGVDLAWRF